MSNTILLLFRIKLKKGGLLLLAIAATFFSYAQDPEEDNIDLILDELFFNEAQFIEDILDSFKDRDFIYTNLSYNSNTYFSGRDSGVDQFSLIPQFTYNHKSGFNASISGIYYEKFSPSWDFTTVSLNYYNTIGKKKQLHFTTGYSRYIYSDGWDIFTNSLDASIGIRNKEHSLGSTITGNFLFGTEHSFQLISNSYFKQTLFKSKKYRVNVKPQISLLIAQQTIGLEQLITQGDGGDFEIIYHDIFDLLNTQLNLPVSITSKSWDASIAYIFNFPSAVATETDLNTSGYLNISVGYLIDLKK